MALGQTWRRLGRGGDDDVKPLFHPHRHFLGRVGTSSAGDIELLTSFQNPEQVSLDIRVANIAPKPHRD